MNNHLLEWLCEPATRDRLELTVAEASQTGEITAGELVSASGRRYPVIGAIPRFVATNDRSQLQTSVSNAKMITIPIDCLFTSLLPFVPAVISSNEPPLN